MQEVEEILENAWEVVKDVLGAAEYANKSDPQRKNSRFKKVLTRKFERLAKGKGNAIKPVSPISVLHM